MGMQSSIKPDKDNRKLGCVLNTFKFICHAIMIVSGLDVWYVVYTSSPTQSWTFQWEQTHDYGAYNIEMVCMHAWYGFLIITYIIIMSNAPIILLCSN